MIHVVIKSNRRDIATRALVSCCKQVPKEVKSRKKRDSSHPPTPIKVLGLIVGLVDVCGGSGDFLKDGETTISAAVMSLLKYGFEEESGCYLNTVRALLSVTAISPATIHNLLTSHSKFAEVLRSDVGGGGGGGGGQKKAIAKLLLATSTTTTTKLDNLQSVASLLLVNYGASLTELDFVIRQILLCYDKIHKLKLRFVDLRWGGVEGVRGGVVGAFNEYLVGMMSPSRVNATLQNFPLFDTIEVEAVGVEEVEEVEEENEEAMEIDKKRVLTKKSVSFDDAINPVQRYSPAFLLPLLLSSLELMLPINENTASQKIYQLAAFSRRVCESGLLSLALASLASRDLKLRKTR